MNKLISKIVGVCLGLSLATGVGVGVAVGRNEEMKIAHASATFVPSDFSGQGTSGSGSNISATKNGVTFTCNKGYGTTQIRCYSGGNITISSSDTITDISFTFSGTNTGGLETDYTGLSTTSWTKNLSSQARVTECTVTTSGGSTPTYPEPSLTETTLAGFIGATSDADNTKLYHFSATVKRLKNGSSNDKYGAMTLTDGTNVLSVYGSTKTTSALAWGTTTGLYTFTNPEDFQSNATTNAIKIGDTVEVKFVRYMHNGALSAQGLIVSVTAGTSPVIPEPSLVNTTLDDFVNNTSDPEYEKLYHFTAEVKALKNGSTNDEYGNMTLTNGDDDLVVYGSTATASALTWDAAAGMYVFTNPKDFQSNTTTNVIIPGDSVEVKFIRYTHNSTLQGQGLIVAVTHAPNITLNKSSLALNVGGNETLTASLENAGSPAPTVTWSSSDTTIATVSGGTVTAVAVGSATITASITVNSKTYSATCSVTVSAAPIVVDNKGVYTKVTDVSDLATGDIVIITSADGAHAMGGQNENNRASELTGISNGEITISTESGANIQAFYLEELTVNNVDAYSFYTGTGYIYAASSSSNYLKTQTTLNDNGKWTIAISSGNATLTAQGTYTRNIIRYNSSNNLFSCYASGQQNVSIFKKQAAVDPTKVASVALSETSLSVETGKTSTLAATITPSTATTQTVTWLSSDSTIATVTAGVVRGVAAGSATITAFADENGNGVLDSSEKSASCNVTVTAAIGNIFYQKVSSTSDLTDGSYLIVHEIGAGLGVALNSALDEDIASNTISVSISENKIASNSTTNASAFTYEASSGTFLGTSNYYIYHTGTKNTLDYTGTKADASNTVTISSGNASIVCGSYYLRFNATSGQERFRYYGTETQEAIQLYKLVEVQSEAEVFAELFLETLSTGGSAVCNAQGNTNISGLQSAWASLYDAYADLSADDKLLFSGGNADEDSENVIEQALALYDYIAAKYGNQLESDDCDNYNFIGRTLSSSSRPMVSILNVSDNDAVVTAIVVVMALTMTTAGAYFFLRKKKEN